MPRPRARLEPRALTRAFAPDGLHGATAQAVARAAGLAKPTIYAHGGSKEAVFLACVEAETERLLSAITDADLRTRSAPARARIAALADAVIAHGREDPAAARLLHRTAHHASSRVADEVDAALARLPARLAQILRRDTTPECAALVAPALLGAAARLALAAEADPGAASTLLADAFAGVLAPLAPSPGGETVQSVGVY